MANVLQTTQQESRRRTCLFYWSVVAFCVRLSRTLRLGRGYSHQNIDRGAQRKQLLEVSFEVAREKPISPDVIQNHRAARFLLGASVSKGLFGLGVQVVL